MSGADAREPKPKKTSVASHYTVCTVTINSEDEKKVFQKRLGTKKFRFVELVSPESGDERHEDSWFERACEQGVRCDILMISGHFAGTFFGEKPATLSLEALEKASCSKKCKGVLSEPREVFLFGCNTLAGKEKDSRTPEQYLTVLLDDGIDRAIAERVVQARYGDYGESMHARMQRVFSGVPHVYGFDSIGPSGSNVKGFLDSYFKKKGDYSKYLGRQEVKRITDDAEKLNRAFAKPKPNVELANALSLTSFTQCSGLLPGDPEFDASQEICRIHDESRSVAERLGNMRSLLIRGNPLPYLPHVEAFFDSHPPSQYSGAELNAWSNLKAAVTAQKKFLLALMESTREKSLRIEIPILANHLGWISDQDRELRVKGVLKELVAFPLKQENINLLCSVRASSAAAARMQIEDLDQRIFSMKEAGNAVRCLHSPDLELNKKIIANWVAGTWPVWSIKVDRKGELAKWLGEYWTAHRGDSQNSNGALFATITNTLNHSHPFAFPEYLSDPLIACIDDNQQPENGWDSWRDVARRDCFAVYAEQWANTKSTGAVERILPYLKQWRDGAWVMEAIRSIGGWNQRIESELKKRLVPDEGGREQEIIRQLIHAHRNASP